jgi:Domain of unknown function (DUF1937)
VRRRKMIDRPEVFTRCRCGMALIHRLYPDMKELITNIVVAPCPRCAGRPFIYLAVPYSHPNPQIRVHRFEIANRIAGNLMKSGEIVYSPISHTHPIAVCCNLPYEFDYWEKVDTAFLGRSKKLIVVMLDGWKESKGIEKEIAIARRLKINISYCYYDIDECLLEDVNRRE